MKRHLLIDGNNIAHAANAGTTLTVGRTQVQAVFGVMRTLRRLMSVYGNLFTPTVLWDGASWRKLQFPDYKANRDREDTAAEVELKKQRESLKKQSRLIEIGVQLLGINQVRAVNMEADDLAGIMVQRFEPRGDKIVLVSGDRDWIQLVSPTVTWFDPINDRKITPSLLPEKYGVKDVKQFLELKALMGDMGDNIPGVGGIGEKGAKDFLQLYGSVADFTNAVIFEKSVDIKSLHKKYRALIEDEEKAIIFRRNLDLMDLKTTRRPAPVNLTVTKGEANINKLRAFCDKLMFRSLTADLNNWTEVFPAYQAIMQEAA